uniref:Uncharacterized protein n=1 Tax=viral metagenome TaxID=1070528 RepID=A0A6C0CYL8_9ZZZZ
MLTDYKYLLVLVCSDNNHICQIYKTIEEISKELKVHRTTISKKLANYSRCEIIKNHEKYNIIKI